MKNKSKMLRLLSLTFAVAGFLFISGSLTDVSAQRDPFDKNPLMKPKNPVTTSTSSSPGKTTPEKKTPPPVMPVGAPAIEQRIAFYTRQREEAALKGEVIPKVTSVLTLEEMAVTGIFRTPRGYAAMIEAKPIKMSYTIYPGEKFFDGQLVAIEENRLVFRKVVKMSNGKFVSTVEDKTLRQYTIQEEVQGTAPAEVSGKTEQASAPATTNEQPTEENRNKPVVSTIVISPLDEMNNQPAEDTKNTAKEKPGKKPVKVAKNKKQ